MPFPLLVNEIADYLQTRGIGDAATGWAIRYGFMPMDPDQVILILEAGGQDPEVRSPVDRPHFAVHVRAGVKDYVGARQKIEEVKRALHAWPGGMLGGTYYPLILAQGDVLPLGVDANERHRIAQNFKTMRSRS